MPLSHLATKHSLFAIQLYSTLGGIFLPYRISKINSAKPLLAQTPLTLIDCLLNAFIILSHFNLYFLNEFASILYYYIFYNCHLLMQK